MSTPGLLICVMGIDGSGKSTATKRVVEQLQHSGVDVGYVWDRWEPRLLAPLMKARGGSGTSASAGRAGDDYRSKRRLMSSPVTASLWLAASSFDYASVGVERVRDALDAHRLTLCDRYTPDFVVDQAMNLGGSADALARASSAPFLRRFPPVDRYVLFDLEPGVAIRRKSDLPSLEVLEGKRTLYRLFAEKVSAAVIDASGPLDRTAGNPARRRGAGASGA